MNNLGRLFQCSHGITFETRTRDDNVCASFLLEQQLSPHILFSQGYSIIVKGGGKSGKTAIIDSILFTVMDDMDPFDAPKDNKMFLESHPSEASSYTVEQCVSVFNHMANVGFKHRQDLYRHRRYLRQRSERVLQNGGLFFLSYLESDKSLDQDMRSINASIAIETTQLNSENIWAKRWKVLSAPRLQKR